MCGVLGGLTLAATPAAADPPLAPNDPTRALPPSPSQSAPLDVHAGEVTGGPQDTTTRLVLRGVEFDGARTVPQDRLRAAWTPYADKPVSLADLRAIGRRAEQIYTRAGYPFVAVVLRVQQVKDGVVHYDVVEGHISDLTVLGSSRTARRQATAALSPLVDKSPLPLSAVEQAYQSAKNVPGLSVSGTLRRGSQPGGMDLVVATQRQEWRSYANVNDLYADPVGPWGVLFGLDHFGNSQYGDELSGQIYTSVPFGRQVLARGSYAYRLNASGTTVTISGLWGHANPKSALSLLAIAQDVASIRLDVAQPLWDRPDAKFQVDLALEGSDQRTNVFSSIRLSDDRLRDLSFTFAGEKHTPLGRLAISGEIRDDLDILGASHPGDPELSRFGADPQATILRGGLEAETRTFEYLRIDVRLDSQWANHALTIPDQYSAGNLTVGRGYQPGSALGDRALAGSAELRIGPFDVAQKKLQVEPFLFTDVVDLWNIGPAAFGHRQLQSVGGGVRFHVNGKAHLDLMGAAPLVPALGLGDRTPAPTVLMNLTFTLDDAFSAIHRKLFHGGGS
ncbi:MAG TPA: POTRA domain-containing protein [Caulobacteraceae bacterium]|nr:POTRA domain-containing protein [Caulobacteraceae bacterium]